MGNEINTRGLLRAKISGFPSGNDAQVLTKSEILATGMAIISGSYADLECPLIDHVQGNVIRTSNVIYTDPSMIYFLKTETSTKFVTVTSERRTTVNGVVTEITPMKWSIKTYPSSYFEVNYDYSTNRVMVYPRQVRPSDTLQATCVLQNDYTYYNLQLFHYPY